MTTRLMLDALRRNWRGLALSSVVFALIWASVPTWMSAQAAMWFSVDQIWIAVMGGAMLEVRRREVWLLPASRQQRWRSWVLLATVVAPLFTLAIKVASFLLTAPREGIGLRFQTLGLSTLYDVASGGLLMWLLMLGGQRGPIAGWPPRARRMVSTAALTALLLWPGVAAAIIWSGPTSWSEVTWLPALLLVAAVGATALTYVVSPDIGFVPGSIPESDRKTAPTASRPLTTGGLTGLRLLLARDALGTLRFVPLMVAFVAITYATIGVALGDGSDWWKDLPFAHVPQPNAGLVGMFGGGVIFFGFYVLINTSLPDPTNSLPALLRQLRTLPLSTTAVTTFLLWRRLVGWLAIWVLAVVVHIVIWHRLPRALDLDLFVLFVGMDAIVQTMALRSPGRGAFVMVVVALSVGTRFLEKLPITVAPGLAIIGAVCLACGATITHMMLRRNRAVYTVPASGA